MVSAGACAGARTRAHPCTRAELDSGIEFIREQPEPYTALRRAYSSQRQSAIRDGVVDENSFDDLPDFDDFDDFDEEFDDFE